MSPRNQAGPGRGDFPSPLSLLAGRRASVSAAEGGSKSLARFGHTARRGPRRPAARPRGQPPQPRTTALCPAPAELRLERGVPSRRRATATRGAPARRTSLLITPGAPCITCRRPPRRPPAPSIRRARGPMRRLPCPRRRRRRRRPSCSSSPRARRTRWGRS